MAEIKLNPVKKNMEISLRIFNDDFEKALKSSHLGIHDLNHPKNLGETENAINQYINQHFYVEIGGKKQNIKLIGFEVEGDACWNYFELTVEKSPSAKIHIHNDILSEAYSDEVNLVRFIQDQNTQSTKLENNKWDFYPEL